MKTNLKALAQELTDLIGNSTPATAVEVVIKDGGLELHPIKENSGDTFFHMEEVVDFCRCKKMNCYVTINVFDKSKVMCRIY